MAKSRHPGKPLKSSSGNRRRVRSSNLLYKQDASATAAENIARGIKSFYGLFGDSDEVCQQKDGATYVL